ncbi:hypothetical protein GCM10008968_04350 [Bacillus horti]
MTKIIRLIIASKLALFLFLSSSLLALAGPSGGPGVSSTSVPSKPSCEITYLNEKPTLQCYDTE